MQLSINDLKDLFSINQVKELPFKIGENYLFRCVTHYHLGKIKDIKGDFLVLEQCSWIADTGRYSKCFKDKNILKEIESIPDNTVININSIVDASPWKEELPTESK